MRCEVINLSGSEQGVQCNNGVIELVERGETRVLDVRDEFVTPEWLEYMRLRKGVAVRVLDEAVAPSKSTEPTEVGARSLSTFGAE